MGFCTQCPLKCRVDRERRTGACHALSTMRISRIAPHFYEEPPISGTNGSGTVFFSGCSLDCEFCQNHLISKQYVGKAYSPHDLANELKRLEDMGVHNINFVTPTHFADKIRDTLDIYRPKIPIVYNTSGYELPEAISAMLPYVDIFLTDFKYISNETALKYSKRSNYVDFCLPSLKIMVKNKPIAFDGALMKQGVIIRHLALPGELENTFGVIDYYAEHYANEAYLSVMSQFTPMYKSTIKRTLTPLEYKIIVSRLLKKGIEKCFIQEIESATSDYTPDFNTDI